MAGVARRSRAGHRSDWANQPRTNPNAVSPEYSFNADRILQDGFTDESAGPTHDKDHPPGVFLTDGQPNGYLTTLIEVRLPEEAVLIYEWPDAGSAARNFYVPAEMVNRLCRARSNGSPET
jgi:hypothetical protein